MQVWPAIDIRGGKCVRLKQGDYDRETVFGDDPAAMARHWVDQGAERIHLVDLDGARQGKLHNLPSVEAILRAAAVPCQLGGGVRDEPTIERLVDRIAGRFVVRRVRCCGGVATDARRASSNPLIYIIPVCNDDSGPRAGRGPHGSVVFHDARRCNCRHFRC